MIKKTKRTAALLLALLLIGQGVSRNVFAAGHGCPQNEPDRDGDGVPDREDDFPDDPTRFKDEDPFGDKKFDEMDQKDFEDYYWQHLLNPYFNGLDWLIPGGIPPGAGKGLPGDLSTPGAGFRIDGRRARAPIPPIPSPGPIQNPLQLIPPGPPPKPRPNPPKPAPKPTPAKAADEHRRAIQKFITNYSSKPENQLDMLKSLISAHTTEEIYEGILKIGEKIVEQATAERIASMPEGRAKQFYEGWQSARSMFKSLSSSDPLKDLYFNLAKAAAREKQNRQFKDYYWRNIA